MNFLTLFAFSISLMISPDNLARLGNLFGWNFNLAMVLILGSAGIYLLLIPALAADPNSAVRYQSSIQPVTRMTGLDPLFSILVKVSAMIFIAAGLTVSSGFAFNEIFIYWFPNFAFAFLLLFLLALLQWLPQPVIVGAQIFFSITALSGMGVIILKGLINGGFQPLSSFFLSDAWSMPDLSQIVFLFLLVFVGFDLGSRVTLGGNKKGLSINPKSVQASKWLWGTILLISAVYVLWGVVLLNHVSPDRLTESTISHLIAARTIWPSAGRYLMGGIIILGSCAAVNGLYFAVRKEIEAFVVQFFPNKNQYIARILVTGCAGITALLLAFGLAGYSALEVLISGAFLLWLIWYLFRLIMGMTSGENAITIFFKCCACLALTLTICGVFLTSGDTRLMGMVLVIFMIILMVLSLVAERFKTD